MTKDSTAAGSDSSAVETPAQRKRRRDAMPMYGGDPARADLLALAAQLAERAREDGVQMTGKDGVIAQVTRMLLESSLEAEMTAHLGREWHGGDADGSGNVRNGHTRKTVRTGHGAIEIEVPRDREGSFTPAIVPKGVRRLEGFDEQVLALYGGGMTIGEIQDYLAKQYQQPVSHDLISQVTDAVLDQMTEWQNRPLDPMYPIVWIDCVHVKIREGTVASRPIYLALAVDTGGNRQVLGMWSLPGGEGKAAWTNVLGEIRNRGVLDVLIVCCDGLTGLADAIRFTWPQAQVQRCVTHLKRDTFRYVPGNQVAKVSAALRPVSDAPNADAAWARFKEFAAEYEGRYPGAVRVWREAWDEFQTYFVLPRELRHMIYTTNMIEAINGRIRTSVDRHGHFPNDTAAKKLIYLVLTDHGPWSERRGQKSSHTPVKKIRDWKICLNALVAHFGDRLTLS